jgi:hypothetical protein
MMIFERITQKVTKHSHSYGDAAFVRCSQKWHVLSPEIMQEERL